MGNSAERSEGKHDAKRFWGQRLEKQKQNRNEGQKPQWVKIWKSSANRKRRR